MGKTRTDSSSRAVLRRVLRGAMFTGARAGCTFVWPPATGAPPRRGEAVPGATLRCWCRAPRGDGAGWACVVSWFYQGLRRPPRQSPPPRHPRCSVSHFGSGALHCGGGAAAPPNKGGHGVGATLRAGARAVTGGAGCGACCQLVYQRLRLPPRTALSPRSTAKTRSHTPVLAPAPTAHSSRTAKPTCTMGPTRAGERTPANKSIEPGSCRQQRGNRRQARLPLCTHCVPADEPFAHARTPPAASHAAIGAILLAAGYRAPCDRATHA